MMSLDIPISIDEIDDSATALPSKTAKIDFDSGRIVGYIDGLDAMEQLVQKTMRTERFAYLIYDNQHGSESDSLIGLNLDEDLFEMEAKRIVKEALLADARITSVYDFEFEKTSDGRIIRFSADSVYGALTGQEVHLSV